MWSRHWRGLFLLMHSKHGRMCAFCVYPVCFFFLSVRMISSNETNITWNRTLSNIHTFLLTHLQLDTLCSLLIYLSEGGWWIKTSVLSASLCFICLYSNGAFVRATCCWIGHPSLSGFVFLSARPIVSAGPRVNSSIAQIMPFDPRVLPGRQKQPY